MLIIGVYIADVTQTKHAIRRNYPVIGHFRYDFEHVGTFFRQYFLTMDREEMPFNRTRRSWGYRTAKNNEQIATNRGIHVGEDSISPNRHLEIENNDDLAELT